MPKTRIRPDAIINYQASLTKSPTYDGNGQRLDIHHQPIIKNTTIIEADWVIVRVSVIIGGQVEDK